MYDESKGKKFPGKDKVEGEKRATSPYNWSILTVEELIRFRDEITRALPPLSLSKINVEEELLLQFHTVRAVQSRVLDDIETPVNQIAQIANSCSSSLNKLAELQKDIYTSELIKRMERLLIDQLTKLPTEVAEAFLTEYEKELDKL